MVCKVILMVLLVPITVFCMPQVFCGDTLTKTLSQYCLSYNTPASRVKRNIVKECCKKPCSLEHMVAYYCASYNRDSLKKQEDENIATENHVKPKNEVIETDSHIGSYNYQNDLVSQVRGDHVSTNSQINHVEHIHSEWALSSERSVASYNRNRRKIKNGHDTSEFNKNTIRKNFAKEAGFEKKLNREPQLGQIEESQRPFYVYKRDKR